jgi:hypothetical protein
MRGDQEGLRMRILPGLVCATALLAAHPATAEVQVRFVNPRGFTDAGLYAPRPVDADAPALVGLRRIIERAGARLPPGDDLAVDVLDVDLAGFFPPWQRSGTPIRVMEPTTWPRITLRYAVTRDGRTVARGEQVVSDMTYLRRPAVFRSAAPLRFEEPMLLDWFATTPAFSRPR